jgi:hypothetical protein
MPVYEDGVDRIIAAVGHKYVPDTLDRSALRRAINESEKRAKIISANRHGARARNRLKRVRGIRDAAKELASLLEVKDDASDLIDEICGEWPQTTVRWLIAYCAAIEEVFGKLKASRWGNPTVNEWLAGAELPCVFAEHFRRPPGGSRNKTYQKGGGPCVRFIEATMRELGRLYSAASIVRALTGQHRLREHLLLVRQGKPT